MVRCSHVKSEQRGATAFAEVCVVLMYNVLFFLRMLVLSVTTCGGVTTSYALLEISDFALAAVAPLTTFAVTCHTCPARCTMGRCARTVTLWTSGW